MLHLETMGKRSNFERREDDFYPTPRKAVLPLVPWLAGVRTFAEPCAGDGALVTVLEEAGLRCLYAADINPRHPAIRAQDPLALDHYGDADCIVTNPPWQRDALHRLIPHFAAVAPAWLLIDQDWSATKQAAPYLRHCTDVLPIGRQIWIPGTTQHGKDSAAWFRFDARHTAGPVLHAYCALPGRALRCAVCGRPYAAQRSDSRTCSNACRQRAYREAAPRAEKAHG